MSNAILLLISLVLLLPFSICIALSVNADCKVHDIKSKSAFTDVAFFFGWIGFIFYMCSRGKAKRKTKVCSSCKNRTEGGDHVFSVCKGDSFHFEKREDFTAFKQKRKRFLIAAVLFFILFFLFTGYFSVVEKRSDYVMNGVVEIINLVSEDRFSYYDMKGNRYFSFEDVLYYDRDGNTYVSENRIDESGKYNNVLVNTVSGEEYPSFLCYIDQDGYLYYDKDEKLQYNDRDGMYYDEQGNRYCFIVSVEWDKNGELTVMKY